MVEWIRSNLACYFGNATAMRDFRIQLRGNRSILLWSFYLIVLIGAAMITYTNLPIGSGTSIVSAQNQLRGFYQAIMILLATMIVLISPAMTAGSIVMERQRRSLDLVFSAPVTPKYYLVGKMISSYRYIWMMLILSLPVTSACVVLGGATWSDVISSYIILSFNALIFTAIALLISTLSKQPVAAIVWSYVATGIYAIFTGFLGVSSAIPMMSGRIRNLEAPFTVTLSPFAVVQASPTYSSIWGYDIPNWVLGGVFAVLLTKLVLLGAGSSLTAYGSKETKSLRIHGLVYAFLLTSLYCYATAAAVALARGVGIAKSGGSSTWTYTTDLSFGWFLIPMAALSPFLCCYGREAERKYQPDGVFSLVGAIKGTVSGALPYLWALTLCSYAGFAWVLRAASQEPPSPAILFWHLSFWTFVWSVGRFASSMNAGLRSARALHFTLLIFLIVFPVPFFAAVHSFSSGNSGIWDLYILRPLIGTEDNRSLAWMYGAGMAVAAVLLTWIAETNAQRKRVVSRVTA